jgi:integrase
MQLKEFRGKWCVYWRTPDNRPVRRSLGTSNRNEAERRFIVFKRELEAERSGRGLTIADLWARRRTALGTQRMASNMKWSGKAILPVFGHLRADMITEELCIAYTNQRLAAGRQTGTIWTELGHLRATLCWASRTNLISKAPAVKRPTPGPPKDLHLTKTEARAFLAGCVMPHIKLFAVLALTTGARASALLELTWDRVDFTTGMIKLRNQDTENKKGRATIPMNATARRALVEAKRGALTDFVIEWRGKQVASVKKGIGEAAKRASLRWVTPHVFRHSAAVWMAEAARPMAEISQFLGHSDEKVTARIYARFSPEFLRGAALALELDEPNSASECVL